MSDPLGLIDPTGGGPMRPIQPLRPPGAGAEAGAVGPDDGSPSFKDALMKNIEQVSQLQQDADRAIEDWVSGRRDDVDGVMVAKEKADMAFQLLLQVRNKMMDAYEEIKQIRV